MAFCAAWARRKSTKAIRATAIWVRAFSEAPRIGGGKKAGDFESLLDPAEEHLDRPAPLVERRDLVGGGIKIIGKNAQYLAGLGCHTHFAHGVVPQMVKPALVALEPRLDLAQASN
jgi:hypothetical protein